MRLVDFPPLTNGCILDIAKSKLGAPRCTHLSFISMRPPAPSFIFFRLHLNHGLAALRPLSLFTNPFPYFCLNALHFFLTVSYALRGWWGETESLSEPSRSPAKRTRAHAGTSARAAILKALHSHGRILLLPPLTAKQHPALPRCDFKSAFGQ